MSKPVPESSRGSRELAPRLVGALMPGVGQLLLSGFTRLQIPAMLAAFDGMTLATQATEGEWALLLLATSKPSGT